MLTVDTTKEAIPPPPSNLHRSLSRLRRRNTNAVPPIPTLKKMETVYIFSFSTKKHSNSKKNLIDRYTN